MQLTFFLDHLRLLLREGSNNDLGSPFIKKIRQKNKPKGAFISLPCRIINIPTNSGTPAPSLVYNIQPLSLGPRYNLIPEILLEALKDFDLI